MFERYTDQARRSIFFARYEASISGSPAIDNEHLLLGLVHENGDLLVKLTPSPDPAGALRKRVEDRAPPPRPRISTSVELPLATGAKDALMKAMEASDTLGHRHIGPEHLLLGLLADPQSFAAEALQKVGITAEGIRSVIGVGDRVAPVPKPTQPEQFRKYILQCLDETFVEVHGMYLDKGCSLFPTLEGVSAHEASSSVSPESATLAAHVEHVRFYLDVLDEMIKANEFVKVDWKQIWRTVSEVTPEEWEEQKQRLRESYDRLMTTLKGIDGWERDYEIAGALSVLSHTAYHLGAIRQALAAIRGTMKNGLADEQ